MKSDVRHLLADYATGTLTEAERKALFEAALNDPELFAEIAHEEPLRELLGSPQNRAELLERIEPASPGFRERFAAWLSRPPVLAGLGATAVAAIILSILPLWQQPSVQPLQTALTIHPEMASPPPAPAAEQRTTAPVPVQPKVAASTFKAPAKAPAAQPNITESLPAPTTPKMAEPLAAAVPAPPPPSAGLMRDAAAPPPPVQYEVQRRGPTGDFAGVMNTAMLTADDVVRVRFRPSVNGFLVVRDSAGSRPEPLLSGQVTAGTEVTAGPILMDRDHRLEVLFRPVGDAGTPMMTAFRSEAEDKAAESTAAGAAPARKSSRIRSHSAAMPAADVSGTITFPIELRRKP